MCECVENAGPQQWPRTGTFGAGAILPLCAQLLWYELYDMKDIPPPPKSSKGRGGQGGGAQN